MTVDVHDSGRMTETKTPSNVPNSQNSRLCGDFWDDQNTQKLIALSNFLKENISSDISFFNTEVHHLCTSIPLGSVFEGKSTLYYTFAKKIFLYLKMTLAAKL